MARTMTVNFLADFRGGGIQRIYTFDNGYQTSVVCHSGSYGGKDGLWELAVMLDDEIVYDTPVTDSVLGWLTDADLADTLNQVEALPHRSTVRTTHLHPS